MIKVENIEVSGFKAAIRGMRNPMNSWDKSDSYFEDEIDTNSKSFSIGENDLDLMKRLYKAGTEHRKYLRFINASLDIVAPLYWWKEADTYKVGTACNSCSTMHKIQEKEFSITDFSTEHLLTSADCSAKVYTGDNIITTSPVDILLLTIEALNKNREMYLRTKDKKYWWQMIQLLPSSYNQRRTLSMNYEVVIKMIQQREGHKLDEWNEFVEVLKTLPYIKEIME